MKRSLFVIVLLALISACSQQTDIERLEKKGMPDFKEPQVTSGVMKNGMRYYLLEDHQLPIVHAGVMTKAGSIYEPADKLGLAMLTGISLRAGGTKELSPEDVDRVFDNMAADAGTSIGLESGDAGIKLLSKDMEKGLALFFDVIFEPRFDPKRVELGRIKMIEALKRENDYPDQVVAREFKKLVYGDSSPWARRPTETLVKGLSVDDLKEFHKRYFVPSNMILFAAGDFKIPELLKLVEKLTADAPNHEVMFPPVAPVELKFPNQERRISKPLTQSYIEVGHLGVKRHNPDKYALEIMDTILGAPVFKSRLMEDIRSNRGLAYTITSDFGWGTDYGLFDVYCDTKTATEGEVIALIREHIARLKDKGDITGVELDFAKKSVLNRLIFEFDNSFKIVGQRARYKFYGYPDNYWHIYRQEIEKVGVEDVKRVAKKYLHPEGLSIVVVGPQKK